MLFIKGRSRRFDRTVEGLEKKAYNLAKGFETQYNKGFSTPALQKSYLDQVVDFLDDKLVKSDLPTELQSLAADLKLQIKNTMNALAAPIFEQIAVKTLQEHKNFFRYDLEVKLSILGEMQSELRKRTEQALIDFAPKSFQLMRDFTKNANKDKIDKILGSLIEGGQLEEGTTLNDILNMEDYESIIYQMQFLLDNYEEIFIQPRFQ